MNLTQQSNKEKYDYFPFVSGEKVEEHRKDLNTQIRNEIQNYMSARKPD